MCHTTLQNKQIYNITKTGLVSTSTIYTIYNLPVFLNIYLIKSVPVLFTYTYMNIKMRVNTVQVNTSSG